MTTGINIQKVLLLVGLAAALGEGCTQNLPQHKFTIIYTNDVHGEFEPCG